MDSADPNHGEPEAKLAEVFYHDIDGYAGWIHGWARNSLMAPVSPRGFVDDLYTLYYLLRSTVALPFDASVELRQAFREFSQGCLRDAQRLALAFESEGKLPVPDWIDFTVEAIRVKLREKFPQVDDIDVFATLEPSVYARSYPERRCVEISAVSREYLRTINLLILTVAIPRVENLHKRILAAEHRSDAAGSESTESNTEALTGEDIFDVLLPFIIALSVPDTMLARLPMPRVLSQRHMTDAMAITHLQVAFVIAHEYAHLLLHTDEPPSRFREQEADAFAYDLVFSAVTSWGYSRDMMFLACRWLFIFLSLDQCAGAALGGYEIDWADLPIRRRDEPLLARFDDLELDWECRVLEMAGSVALFEAKGCLWTLGPEGLRRYIPEFRASFANERTR